MTFETLRYIYRLLEQEEEATRLNYAKAREHLNYLLDLLENQESDQLRQQIKEEKEHCKTLDRIHDKAFHAFNEFREHEWR